MGRRRFIARSVDSRFRVSEAHFSNIRDSRGVLICNSVYCGEDGRFKTFFKRERAEAAALTAGNKYGLRFVTEEYYK